MRNTLRSITALAPLIALAGGCVVAAGAVGGIIISQEVLDDKAVETRVDRPVREVWPIVRSYMSTTSPDLIAVDEAHTTVQANLYAARVTVRVYGYDADRTVMLVSAKKAGFSDEKAALHVSEQLAARLRH